MPIQVLVAPSTSPVERVTCCGTTRRRSTRRVFHVAIGRKNWQEWHVTVSCQLMLKSKSSFDHAFTSIYMILFVWDNWGYESCQEIWQLISCILSTLVSSVTRISVLNNRESCVTSPKWMSCHVNCLPYSLTHTHTDEMFWPLFQSSSVLSCLNGLISRWTPGTPPTTPRSPSGVT